MFRSVWPFGPVRPKQQLAQTRYRIGGNCGQRRVVSLERGVIAGTVYTEVYCLDGPSSLLMRSVSALCVLDLNGS